MNPSQLDYKLIKKYCENELKIKFFEIEELKIGNVYSLAHSVNSVEKGANLLFLGENNFLLKDKKLSLNKTISLFCSTEDYKKIEEINIYDSFSTTKFQNFLNEKYTGLSYTNKTNALEQILKECNLFFNNLVEKRLCCDYKSSIFNDSLVATFSIVQEDEIIEMIINI